MAAEQLSERRPAERRFNTEARSHGEDDACDQAGSFVVSAPLRGAVARGSVMPLYVLRFSVAPC